MKLVVAAVALSILLVACGKKSDAPPNDPTSSNASAATPSKIKKPGEASVGDTAECPVSGEEFDVQATSPHAEHEGKTYYFCCGGCKKKFEKEPGKYVKAKGPST